MREACRQSRAWQRRGFSEIPVAINISAIQLKQPDFVDLVLDTLAEASLDPKLLELELTESVLMADTDPIADRLHRLKAIGLRLSIDDFGTGYSNLRYLSSFPLDRLKIDRSFVSGVGSGDHNPSIVRAIIAMAQSLGLAVVAEGVETREQAAMVTAMGCAEAQGFYFSPPVPVSEIEALFGLQLPRFENRESGPANAA